MKFEPGIIIVAVAMVLFYLRLAWLRGKKRRLARLAELEAKKKGKNRKDQEPTFEERNRPNYEVSSWWLIGIGAFLMLFGLLVRTAGWFPEAYAPYWWVPATLGVLVFAFSFK